MLWENRFWYWYGENKEYTDGQSPLWSRGVRMYRSADLYNGEGPDLNNPEGNLFPKKYLDRPHILRCDATGKYVMWVKISGPESCFAVLQADRLQGPYETIQEDYYLLGNSLGDFDLVVDADGKAYLYADTLPSRWQDLNCAKTIVPWYER